MLLLIGLVALGCKKDGEPDPNNSFLYDGKEFELSKGLMIDYGQVGPDLGYNLDLFLISPGITIHEVAGKLDETTGKGHFMYFEIFSSVKDILAEGDYVFDTTGTFKGNTFDYSAAVFNVDYDAKISNPIEITSGKISVKKAGSDFVLLFDFEMVGGKKLTGYYKGPIKYYNEK